MKKLLLLPTLLFSATMFSQESYISVSGGFDMRNAVVGSAPTGNKPALNWIGQVDCVGANVHIIAGYESFSEIKYSRIFAGIGYEFNLYAYPFGNEIRTQFIPSLEASIIKREYVHNYTSLNGVSGTEIQKPGFMAYGLNLAFQWDLTDHFTVGTSTNIIQRPDKNYLYHEDDRYVLSNYLKVILKLNQN